MSCCIRFWTFLDECETIDSCWFPVVEDFVRVHSEFADIECKMSDGTYYNPNTDQTALKALAGLGFPNSLVV